LRTAELQNGRPKKNSTTNDSIMCLCNSRYNIQPSNAARKTLSALYVIKVKKKCPFVMHASVAEVAGTDPFAQDTK